jgi:hypothetical protein
MNCKMRLLAASGVLFPSSTATCTRWMTSTNITVANYKNISRLQPTFCSHCGLIYSTVGKSRSLFYWVWSLGHLLITGGYIILDLNQLKVSCPLVTRFVLVLSLCRLIYLHWSVLSLAHRLSSTRLDVRDLNTWLTSNGGARIWEVAKMELTRCRAGIARQLPFSVFCMPICYQHGGFG